MLHKFIRFMELVLNISLILLMSFSMIYFVLVLVFGFGLSEGKVFYWVAMSAIDANRFGLFVWIFYCFMICGLLLVVLNVFSTIFNNSSTVKLRKLVSKILFTLTVSSFFLCSVTFLVFFQIGPLGSRQHIASISIDDYTYNLSFYAPDFAENYTHRYILYECPFSLLCDEVYSFYGDRDQTIELQTDTTTQEVILIVNDSIVFRYQP